MIPDTIAAISTPPASGGIGIIRISGPDAGRIAGRLFVRADAMKAAAGRGDAPQGPLQETPLGPLREAPRGPLRGPLLETLRKPLLETLRRPLGQAPREPLRAGAGGPPPPEIYPPEIDLKAHSHRVLYGYILDAARGGRVIDEALLIFMAAPRSYTREDVAEIQAHAGPVALAAILDAVLALGARLAEPGEFTRRAFLNGRIDLSRAEAVIDLIGARSERAAEAAARQMTGALRDRVASIRQAVRQALATIEAEIDFGEDVGEIADPAELRRRIDDDVLTPLDALLAAAGAAQVLREGMRVVVVGRPNVGKSSIMNALLGQDRMIVTPVPGTTRDVVDAHLTLNGMGVRLWDTAGLRRTDDPVERIGVERARAALAEADLALLVVDAAAPLHPEDLAAAGDAARRPWLLAMNKWDLVTNGAPAFVPPPDWSPEAVLRVSALTGHGMKDLKGRLGRMAPDADVAQWGMPNARHRDLLDQSRAAALRALRAMDSGLPMDLVAMDLSEILGLMGAITGETAGPDLLDAIFSRFCIGK